MTEDRERGPLDFDDDAGAEAPAPPAPAAAGPLDFDEDAPPARRSHAVGARPADRAADGSSGAPASRRSSAPGMQYLWVVGAGAIVLVLLLLVATLRHGTERGARGVPIGQVMPAFAVPTALGPVDGDANIAQHAGEGEAGHEPACTVRGRDIVNGCALRAAGPVVLAFFTVKSKGCVAQLDAMQRVQRQVPGVRFAAVAIRGDRDDLRAIVRRHGWSFPVGFDRDGALSNAYHVQVCPQLTFARQGGRVVETTFGQLGPAALAAKARSLAARS